MANFGYALAKGLEGGANAIGLLADQKIREDADARAADRALANQERLMAAQEMMKQRAKEWDQSQAKTRALEIRDKAKGILGGGTSEPVIGYEGDSGDIGVAQGSIPGDVGASDLDIARAEYRAAKDLGYANEAKDSRAILEFERRSQSDENRDRAQTDANILREKIANSKDENEKKRLEVLLAKALSGGSDKSTQVTGEDGVVYTVTGGKAVPITGPDGKPIKSHKAAQADAAANAKTAAQIDKEIGELRKAMLMSPKEKPAIQAQIDALTAQKRELQGVSIPTAAANPNRKPLSAFGK